MDSPHESPLDFRQNLIRYGGDLYPEIVDKAEGCYVWDASGKKILDFTSGHWLTVFRDRLSGQAPEPQMRIMTRDRPKGLELSNAIPAYDTQPARLMIKLLAAWAAMGFRRPKVAW